MNKYNSASKITPNSPESGFSVQTAIVIAWFLSELVLQCHLLHVPGMFHLWFIQTFGLAITVALCYEAIKVAGYPCLLHDIFTCKKIFYMIQVFRKFF